MNEQKSTGGDSSVLIIFNHGYSFHNQSTKILTFINRKDTNIKKVFCFFLTLCIVVSLSCAAQATEATNSLSVNAAKNITPYAFVLDFGGLTPGKMVHSGEYEVTQGETVLKITSCSWNPAGTITIGFYGLDSGREFGIQYINGSIGPESMTTVNVPSGRYAIYVRNNNTKNISSGVLRFEVNG